MPLSCRSSRRLPRAGLAMLACLAGGLPYGLAVAAGLPPIGGPGPVQHHPGKVIWADLVTPDLAASETFYSGLFGWTFKPAHPGATDYAVAVLEDRPIAGVLQRPVPEGEHRQPAWLTFIAVRDVDATVRLTTVHGGTRLDEAKTYPGRGRQAVLSDPDGAVFAVLASSSGDPPDVLASPGEWIWSTLLVSDPARDADFYKAVFGYDVFDLPKDDASTEGAAVHVILSTDGYARASLNSLPAQGHRRAHWLNFVRVPDAAAATAKAVSLGGRVLVEPHVDRHGGRIAVVADPAGAPIGLMEWSEGESTAEPTASTAEPTP